MTLLVTELSEYGIVMAAETALPPLPHVPPPAAAHHLQETPLVQAVPYLRAGVGIWGCRALHTSEGWVSAGNWLGDFIAKARGVADLEAFADRLARTLRALHCRPEDPAGFHIAGYTAGPGGQPRPVFYHVSNSETNFQEYYLRAFSLRETYWPESTEMRTRRFAGCDVGAYGRLWQRMETVLPAVDDAVPGIPRPQPSLEGRMAHLVACMQFVAGLYVSGIPGLLGDSRIELLGVPPEGDSHHRIIPASPEPPNDAVSSPPHRVVLRSALARDVVDG